MYIVFINLLESVNHLNFITFYKAKPRPWRNPNQYPKNLRKFFVLIRRDIYQVNSSILAYCMSFFCYGYWGGRCEIHGRVNNWCNPNSHVEWSVCHNNNQTNEMYCGYDFDDNFICGTMDCFCKIQLLSLNEFVLSEYD